MKIAAAVLALASVASAARVSSNTARKLVRSARRVEEEEAEEEQEEEEFSFLGNYNVKMIGCQKELTTPIVNEEGEYEYSAVLLRLCPASDCSSDAAEGCSGGYGDLLVGVETFVEAYMEDMKEQQEQEENDGEEEDEFDMEKFAKCEEFQPDEYADDGNQGAWENYQFFVGPTCSDDGLGLKLELFTDEYCSQVSEVEFETISNGWTLPYSEGGLVSTYCNSCTQYNDDGEAEIKEICMKSYEDAALKCEENMEFYSYYGQNTQGCETIAEMFPKSKGGNAGKIFGWFVLAAVVVGLGGYVMWWRKKKAATIE